MQSGIEESPLQKTKRMQRSILLRPQNWLSHACARTRTHCSFAFLLSQVSHFRSQHTESKSLTHIFQQIVAFYPSTKPKQRLVSIKTWDISIKTRLTTFFQCRQKATATDFVASCCDTCDSKKHKISMIRARAYREKEGISIFSIPY